MLPISVATLSTKVAHVSKLLLETLLLHESLLWRKMTIIFWKGNMWYSWVSAETTHVSILLFSRGSALRVMFCLQKQKNVWISDAYRISKSFLSKRSVSWLFEVLKFSVFMFSTSGVQIHRKLSQSLPNPPRHLWEWFEMHLEKSHENSKFSNFHDFPKNDKNSFQIKLSSEYTSEAMLYAKRILFICNFIWTESLFHLMSIFRDFSTSLTKNDHIFLKG